MPRRSLSLNIAASLVAALPLLSPVLRAQTAAPSGVVNHAIDTITANRDAAIVGRKVLIAYYPPPTAEKSQPPRMREQGTLVAADSEKLTLGQPDNHTILIPRYQVDSVFVSERGNAMKVALPAGLFTFLVMQLALADGEHSPGASRSGEEMKIGVSSAIVGTVFGFFAVGERWVATSVR